MPIARIQLEDGRVARFEVPEGTTPERAQQIARTHFRNAEAKKPTSFLQGFNESLNTVASNLNKINPVNAAMEALGIGSPARNMDRKIATGLKNSPYRGSTAGKIAGGVVGTLPTALIPGGPFAQGAAAGAMLSDKPGPKGVATDALIGGVAGKVGDTAIRGLSRVISPKVAPVVQRLKERGVKMTPGQILGATDSKAGQTLKGIEDRLTGVPVVGEVVTNARRRSVETFNRAALNEPLKSIGKSLPKNAPVGNEGVAIVERELGKAYDDILPKMTATGDAQFMDDLVRIRNDATTMAPARAQQFDSILKDLDRFWKPGNVLKGKDLKALESRLGERIRNYGGGADPDARDLANALGSVQSAIRDLAARQNPAQAARLKAINEGWAKFTRTQRAAAFAKEGIFTPSQLNTATRVMDKSGRKAASARGDALMQKFAQDAQAVLPSSVPDSGTAGRLMLGLGAGGYVNPPAAMAGGAAMLPYTKPGQAAAEWLLTGRQGPVASTLADYLRLVAPAGGNAAAVLSSQK